MRLKSYFAESVEAALHRARRELGEEAMLLDTRPTSPEARHLGAYEVVLAAPEDTPKEAEPPPSLPKVAVARAARTGAREHERGVLEDIAGLRREMERMREAIARSGSLGVGMSGILQEPGFARIYAHLLVQDMPSELAQELLAGVAQAVDGAGTVQASRLVQLFRTQLRSRLSTNPELGYPLRKANRTRRVVALVGPPGSGKTSALVKLAIQYGLASRSGMQLITLDSYRVAGAEPLRSYASILGVGFQTADGPGALARVLEQSRDTEWTWIDTPGVGPKEMDILSEIRASLSPIDDLDVHLVLSAAMKSADLNLAIERLASFGARKLLFTHLDETESYGAMLGAVIRSRLPVSFLSSGQGIPEDLEAARVDRLIELIADGLPGPSLKPFAEKAGSAVAGL